MLAWAGSSHQDGVLLWELGLAWAASLNWEDTLLTREGSGGPSARLNMLCSLGLATQIPSVEASGARGFGALGEGAQ